MSSKPKGQDKSRREIYKDADIADEEPEDDCIWILDCAMQCGLSSSSGMGVSPITWGEIKSWQDVTFNSSAWLAIVVKQLSIAYVSFYNKSEGSESAQSPLYKHQDIQEQRKLVSHQLKNLFGRGG